MTIKGLFKLIKTRAPGAVSTQKLTSFSGKYVFIDASLFVYKWIATGATNKIFNAAGDHVNHIQGCIWTTCALLRAGIIPVYVFDGAPPVEKAALIESRRAARDAGAIRVPAAVFTAVEKLLDLMGVQFVHADGEAEATAAALARIYGGAVATEDSDCLLFGAPVMIRGIPSDEVEVVDLAAIRHETGFSHAELVDLGIILGSDYTEKPAKIGPVRGYNIIKMYKTIDAALVIGAFVAPARFDYNSARAIFAAEPLITADLMPKTAQIGALHDYIDSHGLKYERFSNALSVLEK